MTAERHAHVTILALGLWRGERQNHRETINAGRIQRPPVERVEEQGSGAARSRGSAHEGRVSSRHRDMCTRFAVRMLGSHADADDVLQSAFMRAYRGLAKCRDRERFGGWLYRIVVNECRTFASRQRQRDLRFVNDAGVIDRAEAKREDASAEDMSEQIDFALAKLPVEQREAFLLKHVEGLAYEEIAELTGARIPALKMRVLRAWSAGPRAMAT